VVTDGLVRRSYFRLHGRLPQVQIPREHLAQEGFEKRFAWGSLQGRRLFSAIGSAVVAGLRFRDAFRIRGSQIRNAKEPQKGGDGGSGSGTAVITRPKIQTRRPSMYRVLLLNDDYTPMEFVVSVLKKYFNKGPEEATRIMLHVHQHGVGECGIFTYEVAETKVTQVMDYARKHQHPLQCIMEKK
jgi:ATP-dependent Clp protease adaptor protein ClpS